MQKNTSRYRRKWEFLVSVESPFPSSFARDNFSFPALPTWHSSLHVPDNTQTEKGEKVDKIIQKL